MVKNVNINLDSRCGLWLVACERSSVCLWILLLWSITDQPGVELRHMHFWEQSWRFYNNCVGHSLPELRDAGRWVSFIGMACAAAAASAWFWLSTSQSSFSSPSSPSAFCWAELGAAERVDLQVPRRWSTSSVSSRALSIMQASNSCYFLGIDTSYTECRSFQSNLVVSMHESQQKALLLYMQVQVNRRPYFCVCTCDCTSHDMASWGLVSSLSLDFFPPFFLAPRHMWTEPAVRLNRARTRVFFSLLCRT